MFSKLQEGTKAMATKRDQDFYLNQVRALLERADHPNTPPAESASARARAEYIMAQYRIEQEQLLAEDPQAAEPEIVTIDITTSNNEFAGHYGYIFGEIARHTMVRSRMSYSGGTLVARAVGYATDLKYAELLFTSARMAFAEHLEPSVRPELSDQENAYRLRRSGMERWRVAQLLWGSDPKDGAAHGKVAKMYAAECKVRGEDAALTGRGVQAKIYRQAYANGFAAELRDRLRKARDGAGKDGGALRVAGRQERVDEAFYELYPEMRPSTSTEISTRTPEPEACVACKKAKTGKCRQHRAYRPTLAERRRNDRLWYSDEASAGRRAGADAAEQVELDGSAAKGRLDDRSAQEREATNVIKGVLGS